MVLASYHGIPRAYFERGDPYHCHCLEDDAAAARAAGLGREEADHHLPVALRRAGMAAALHRQDGRAAGAGRRQVDRRRQSRLFRRLHRDAGRDRCGSARDLPARRRRELRPHSLPQRQRRGHGGDRGDGAPRAVGLGLSAPVANVAGPVATIDMPPPIVTRHNSRLSVEPAARRIWRDGRNALLAGGQYGGFGFQPSHSGACRPGPVLPFHRHQDRLSRLQLHGRAVRPLHQDADARPQLHHSVLRPHRRQDEHDGAGARRADAGNHHPRQRHRGRRRRRLLSGAERAAGRLSGGRACRTRSST